MITTFSDSVFFRHLSEFGGLKTALLEPALVLVAALFWIAALPLVALTLFCVKFAIRCWHWAVRPNPLILRA